MNTKERIERVSAIAEQMSGLASCVDVSLGVGDDVYEAVRSMPGADEATHVYDGRPPYAIEMARVRVGCVEIRAQRPRRVATAEEAERLERSETRARATTIRTGVAP